MDAQEWLTVILKDDNYWDQNAFNDLMRRGAEYEERRDDRLFKCAIDPTSLCTKWQPGCGGSALVQLQLTRYQPSSMVLCRGYDGKFLFGILPVATFCSGHTFFVQRMPDKLGLDPYVAHATFQYSGTPGKRHRFREALLWNVRPTPSSLRFHRSST